MKIYEIRDVTNEESYFTQGYFSDKEKAIGYITADDGYTVAECADEFDGCRLAVYEHEIDALPWNGHGRKICEVAFYTEYDEVKDEYIWKHTVEKLTPKTTHPKENSHDRD